ncbi:MAG: hypothetical protein GX557_11335 [Chloroflexi bacterium]|nr:hypothetical protein [Chloroflexota bacterium]
MSSTIAQLERLRCAVAAPESRAGSLADYIDRGHPNDTQLAEASADMEHYRAEIATALQALCAALAAARRVSPDTVAAWVAWHRERCLGILAEEGPDRDAYGNISDHAVRRHVARETLAEWDKVLAGEQDYVRINDFFLADYAVEAERLANATGETPA